MTAQRPMLRHEPAWALALGLCIAVAAACDSCVGQWEAGERRAVGFDYGRYSSTLGDAERMLSDYVECSFATDGIPARFVAGCDTAGKWQTASQKYVAAAAWRDVCPDTHFTLWATSDRAEEQLRLAAIIRSVRFNR